MNAEVLDRIISGQLKAAAAAEPETFRYEHEGSEHRLLRTDVEGGIGLAMAVQPDAQRQALCRVWRVRKGSTYRGSATLIFGDVAGPQDYVQEPNQLPA